VTKTTRYFWDIPLGKWTTVRVARTAGEPEADLTIETMHGAQFAHVTIDAAKLIIEALQSAFSVAL